MEIRQYDRADREKHLDLIMKIGNAFDGSLPQDLRRRALVHELPMANYLPSYSRLFSEAFDGQTMMLQNALEALSALVEKDLISPAVILGYKVALQVASKLTWEYKSKDRKEHHAVLSHWRFLPRHFEEPDSYLAFFLLLARDSLPSSNIGYVPLQRGLRSTGLHIPPEAKLGTPETPENLHWNVIRQRDILNGHFREKVLIPGKISPPELNKLLDLSTARKIVAARVKRKLAGKREALDLKKADKAICMMLEIAILAKEVGFICRSQLAKGADWPIEQRLLDLHQLDFNDDMYLEALEDALSHTTEIVRRALEIESL